jgi:hypothetical protein
MSTDYDKPIPDLGEGVLILYPEGDVAAYLTEYLNDDHFIGGVVIDVLKGKVVDSGPFAEMERKASQPKRVMEELYSRERKQTIVRLCGREVVRVA